MRQYQIVGNDGLSAKKAWEEINCDFIEIDGTLECKGFDLNDFLEYFLQGYLDKAIEEAREEGYDAGFEAGKWENHGVDDDTLEKIQKAITILEDI